MRNIAPHHSGRHFLQIPGPTNVPDRVLQAIAMPTIDHRGPEFALLGQEIVAGMKRVFQTEDTVVVYPSSGTGAWEAALTNTLSPDEGVLMFETGHFATLWRQMATRLGLDIEPEPRRHLAPQGREMAGLEHQHPLIGRERVGECGLPCPGARRRVDDDGVLGLEDPLHAGDDLLTEQREFRAAMVDR